MTASVSLDRVTFRYPMSDTAALDVVSLACGPGITWLYGRLGAGCSTLLLVAAGLAPQHTGGALDGRVALLGETLAGPGAGPDARQRLAGRVAYVAGSPQLGLSGVAATAWEEVAFAPANLGWPIDRIRGAVDAALRRLDVAHLATRDPATLSGGELQRVILAAMLALAPAVWLLDEPGEALDVTGRRLVAELLRDEADRGAAIVLASEDADGLVELADRVVVVERGRIVRDGAPAAILADETIWEVGPGSTSIAAVAREVTRLDPACGPAEPYPLTVADGVERWGRR